MLVHALRPDAPRVFPCNLPGPLPFHHPHPGTHTRTDEDAGLRAQLEAEFQALCERETGLMAELATLSAVEE